MKKGSEVRIVGGEAQGQRGVVFWSGPSKFGPGIRLGVKTDAGATVWVAADQVESADRATSYPYRFYGHGCAEDWIEGANDGHCFTVQFSRAPTRDELTLLGEAFTASLKSGSARPSRQPWEWSGCWALFEVGERGRATGSAIVAAVQRFLDEAHRLVPLVDVVYFNARAGTDDWDEWSVAQGPPDPGPFLLTQVGLFPRPHDPALARPETSEAFERGRNAEANAKAKQAVEKALAKLRDKPIRVELVDPGELPRRPSPFTWSTDDQAGFEVPEPQVLRHENPPGQVWHEWQVGDHPLTDVPGRPLAWLVREAGQPACDLVWIDDQGARRTPSKWTPTTSDSRFQRVVVHPSGAYAILTVHRMEYLEIKQQLLYRVDFQSGAAQAIHTCKSNQDGSLGRIAFVLGGDRIAVSTAKRLFLIDPTSDKAKPLVPAKHAGGAICPIFEGRGLLAETSRGWRIYGVAPNALKLVGTLTAPLRLDFEHQGQVFFTAAGDHYELIGAREAVERFHSRVKKAGAS